MPSAEQFRIATGLGLFLLWLGLVALQIRYRSVSTFEYVLAAFCALYILALTVPGISDHPASPAVSLGVGAVAAGANAVRTGSVLYGAFAAMMAVGALVELYNWRTGAELLRTD